MQVIYDWILIFTTCCALAGGSGAASGNDNETDERDNDDLGKHHQSPIADHLLC